MYWTSGGARFDGPASAFTCSFERARGVSYGRNRRVYGVPVLVDLVSG